MRTETREVFLAFDDTPFTDAANCRNYEVTNRIKPVAEVMFANHRTNPAMQAGDMKITSAGKLVDILKQYREQLTDIFNELDDREDLV